MVTTSVRGLGTRVAVAVFAGHFDLRRDFGDALQPVLGGAAAVVAGAAGQDQHRVDVLEARGSAPSPKQLGHDALARLRACRQWRAAARRFPFACSGGTGPARPRRCAPARSSPGAALARRPCRPCRPSSICPAAGRPRRLLPGRRSGRSRRPAPWHRWPGSAPARPCPRPESAASRRAHQSGGAARPCRTRQSRRRHAAARSAAFTASNRSPSYRLSTRWAMTSVSVWLWNT